MEHIAAAALSQHSHTWGPIQHETPPAYMLAAHGGGAFAGRDDRYRACTGRGCHERAYGADVEHPSVLAHLDARAASDRFPIDTTPASARLTTARATA